MSRPDPDGQNEDRLHDRAGLPLAPGPEGARRGGHGCRPTELLPRHPRRAPRRATPDPEILAGPRPAGRRPPGPVRPEDQGREDGRRTCRTEARGPVHADQQAGPWGRPSSVRQLLQAPQGGPPGGPPPVERRSARARRPQTHGPGDRLPRRRRGAAQLLQGDQPALPVARRPLPDRQGQEGPGLRHRARRRLCRPLVRPRGRRPRRGPALHGEARRLHTARRQDREARSVGPYRRDHLRR